MQLVLAAAMFPAKAHGCPGPRRLRTVTFRKTKNQHSRTIPLSEAAVIRLRNLSKVRRIDSEFVFPSLDGTRPKNIRAGWDKAVKAAAIKDFRFHDLRHTAASYLAMSGASPSELAAILGHRTLLMVSRYAHVAEQHTAGVVNRMADNFLS